MNSPTDPVRVRKLSETFDLFEDRLSHFGCVGTVQDKCAELLLKRLEEVRGETRRVSSAPLKLADGSLRVPSIRLLCRPILA